MKSEAAAQLKREFGVGYETAFVLLYKLREATLLNFQAHRVVATGL